MLLTCSGLHAHYTGSCSESLLGTPVPLRSGALAACPEEGGEAFEAEPCWGLMIVIIRHERGMPCIRASSERKEYVPGSCTHRPSLSVMGCTVELFRGPRAGRLGCGPTLSDTWSLEETEVVTRYL